MPVVYVRASVIPSSLGSSTTMLDYPGSTLDFIRPLIAACCRTPLPTASRRGRRARLIQKSEPGLSVLPDLILPDTLRFHPARPSGFTFAAMNGRRPEDAVDPVVQTILAGAPRAGRSDLQYQPSSQFPYFASTIAA